MIQYLLQAGSSAAATATARHLLLATPQSAIPGSDRAVFIAGRHLLLIMDSGCRPGSVRAERRLISPGK